MAYASKQDALPQDLFAPRADELLLLLVDDTSPAFAPSAPKEGSWVCRVRLAGEGVLFQRPAGWTLESRPSYSEPSALVPYNTGFPDAAPQFGTVDAAAWGAFYEDLRTGCDSLCDPFFVNNCGLRIYDARHGLTLMLTRTQWRVARLTGPIILPAYLFTAVFSFFCYMLLILSIPTFLLEAVLFALLRFPAVLCCGAPWTDAPLPGIGAEARNAEHLASRTAVIDDFAKKHNLVIAYESVAYTGWNPGSSGTHGGGGEKARWMHKVNPALRVRRAMPDGPPAGLLLGNNAV